MDPMGILKYHRMFDQKARQCIFLAEMCNFLALVNKIKRFSSVNIVSLWHVLSYFLFSQDFVNNSQFGRKICIAR